MRNSERIPADRVFDDPQFRLAVMRIPQHAPMAEQHSHDFDELVVILHGTGKHEVGQETYDLEAGDVFVLLGDMTHRYAATKDLSLVNLLYDPRQLGMRRGDLGAMSGYHALFQIEPRIRRRQRFKNRLRLGMDELGRLAGLITEMEEEISRHAPGWQFATATCFMRIILFLSRSYSKIPAEEPRPVSQISEVLGFMEAHYAQALTVGDLARAAHMSETSLFRNFQRVLNRTPIEHLIHLRISKARAMLGRADLSITQIASHVGFADSNYFSRQFRALAGISPREYRRLLDVPRRRG